MMIFIVYAKYGVFVTGVYLLIEVIFFYSMIFLMMVRECTKIKPHIKKYIWIVFWGIILVKFLFVLNLNNASSLENYLFYTITYMILLCVFKIRKYF